MCRSQRSNKLCLKSYRATKFDKPFELDIAQTKKNPIITLLMILKEIYYKFFERSKKYKFFIR